MEPRAARRSLDGNLLFRVAGGGLAPVPRTLPHVADEFPDGLVCLVCHSTLGCPDPDDAAGKLNEL
eukprot:7933207-Alexandrium_andersonii.AAC.1